MVREISVIPLIKNTKTNREITEYKRIRHEDMNEENNKDKDKMERGKWANQLTLRCRGSCTC